MAFVRIIIRENSKIHTNDALLTRRYRIIREYPRYYLCECLGDNKPVYKECFLKIDIDGVKEIKKTGNAKPGGYYLY